MRKLIGAAAWLLACMGAQAALPPNVEHVETFRGVTQYHTLDGELLAEHDPAPHHNTVLIPQEALDWLNGEHVDGFEKPIGAKGEFWWRSEFRKRAGL